MRMSPAWFPVAVLGVWRITHLLVAEDGPADAIVRLRTVAGSGRLGAMLDCFACTSVWVAVPFALALGRTTRERLLLWPALSAGAMLAEEATAPSGRAQYVEHAEMS